MIYLKSVQPIPGKGDSYTFFEANEDYSVVRMLTHIPVTGEISLYEKPVMKKVFMPERLKTVKEKEFTKLWQKGEKKI